MADESATTPPVEPGAVTPPQPSTGDGSGKTPTPYELELRKENEKLRKKLEARVQAEEEAKKKALEEQGKFKDLYEQANAQLTPLQERLKKYEEQETKHREELLSRLPEDKREKYAAASTDILEDVIAVLTGKPDPTKAARAQTGPVDKKWEDLTSEEQNELRSSDRAKYKRLYTEYYKAKNGIPPPFIP